MPRKPPGRCSFMKECLNYDRHADLCNEMLGVQKNGSHCDRKKVVAQWLEEHKEKYPMEKEEKVKR